MNGPYAFISYAREDESVVQALQRVLQLNGINTWLDRTEVHVGDDLQKRVFEAVDGAQWVVPVVSKNTLRSAWVLKEYLHATGASKKKRHIYPVVVVEPEDRDPRAVLRMSWFGDQLEPMVNATIPRDGLEASHVRDLIAAIQQGWPVNEKRYSPTYVTSPEAKSRKLLWSTFPQRFYELECRFRDLAWDSITAVWVVVGLPSAGSSALVGWLQARCPYATRIDVASDRYGTLDERLRDVLVDVLMFDDVWSESDMLRVLSVVEDLHAHKRLLLVTCTPALLQMVEDRLTRIGACYSVNHERGVGREETRELVKEYSKDPAYRAELRELAEMTAVRRRDGLRPDPDPPSADGGVWEDETATYEHMWSRIAKTWLPFNPAALGDEFDPAVALPNCHLDEEGHPLPPEAPCALAKQFSTSLYEAEHRLQQFWEGDEYHPSGLPKLQQWKLDYVQRTFSEGLSPAQQDAIRCVVRFGDAWSPTASQTAELALLERCFIVGRQGRSYHLSDRIFAQYFVPPLVIHHLSDLHVSVKQGASLPATLACYRDEILSDAARCPHVIVISGDIFGEVYCVGQDTSSEPGKEIRDWFEAAAAKLAKKKHPFVAFDPREPRILVVGGNQDVDPITEADIQTPNFWSARRRRRSMRRLLEKNIARHGYHDDGAPDPLPVAVFGPLRVALIDSCAYGVDDTNKQSTSWWLDLLYGLVLMSSGTPDANAQSVQRPDRSALQGALREILNLSQKSAGAAAGFVRGMSSLVLDDRTSEREHFVQKLMRAIGDFEPGYVSNDTLERLQNLVQCERQSDDSVVRLAALHHPLGSAPRDFFGGPSELRNAGRVREVLANARVAVAMHGHLHMHWFDELRNPLRSDWVLRSLSAPAFGGPHDDALGFNELRIRWEGAAPRVLQRAVTRHAGAWVPAKGYEFEPGTHASSTLIPA